MRMAGVVLLTIVSIAYVLLGIQLTISQVIFTIDSPDYVYLLVNPNQPGIYHRVYFNPVVNILWFGLTLSMIAIGVIGIIKRNASSGMKRIWLCVIIHAGLFTIASWFASSLAPLVTVLPMSFLFFQGMKMNERSPDPNKKRYF